MKTSNLNIDPEEIRTIRQSLGLSQVEAGELLAGGPRAFTKYEAGTVKPSASVINLLRLLEVNPTMIAKLQEYKPQPIATFTTVSPFDVTGEHIATLTERMLPQLLRRLLHAEAQTYSLPADGIHVASSISTPDGGEDGYFKWEDNRDRTPFLPGRSNQFQLKSAQIAPSAAGADVLAKTGAVKDMVRSALEAGGCYIMLCAHKYTRKLIVKREDRIREALRNAGMKIDDSQIQFRDADQIAAWTNSHPSVAVWVKELIQPGSVGPFHSWSHWADRAEHYYSPWVEDERLSALRARLYEQITRPHGIVRVVGLSGVGKSRLVLEALNSNEEGGNSLRDIVAYVYESEVDSKAIYSVVQTWADMGQRVVVIVDCCPSTSHKVLTGLILRPDSRLSLVTIDNEIPESLDETMFKVDEAPASVIKAVINRVVPILPSQDKRRLEHFSKGFPGIAIRVRKAWTKNIPVARATDKNFVDAFVLGREEYEHDLIIKSAMLLATFGLVEAGGNSEKPLEEIASRGRGLTAADFRFAVQRLVGRGVAHRRGRFVIVQPRPVAMNLTERQWREWNLDEWDEVLAGGVSSNLRVLAAKQLALLNTTDVSKKVVTHVCRSGGLFDGFEWICQSGHAEVLSALAEIDSKAVVLQIKRSLTNVGNLSEIRDNTRRQLVWALEKITFCPDTFEDGARLLLRFAVAENEDIDNNATGQFKALFPMVAGNTAADGSARLSILDEAADTDDPTQRLIVVGALIAGVKTNRFSRFVGAETHGARPALEDWRPATREEATDYIEGCVKRLAQFANQVDEFGVAARAGLGRHLRSLISFGLIDTVESVVNQISSVGGQWNVALNSLSNFLNLDITDNDSEMVGRIKALIAKLEPASLEERVRFLITEMPWSYPRGENLDYETRCQLQVEAVNALAEEIIEQPVILEEILPQISRNQQRMAYFFGDSIARVICSPLDWLEKIELAVMETPVDERNFDLLSGYLAGIFEQHRNVVNAFKERAAQSPDLAPALPQICLHLGITSTDIELTIGALHAGLMHPKQLMHWTLGGGLDNVPAPEVAPLFDVMLDRAGEAFGIGLELMGMYALGVPDRLESLRPQVRKSAEEITRWELIQDEAMADYHFEEIMKWMLEKGRQDEDACATAFTLTSALVHLVEINNEPVIRVIKPVLPILLSGFPEIVWPLIGQAIIANQIQSWRFELVLGNPFSFKWEEPTILSLPEDALFAWCHAHPDRAPNFVAAVSPILTSYQIDAPERSLHPVMTRLLDEFGDSEDMLRSIAKNINSFAWTGSVTTYYARYQAPLTALQDHPRVQVRRWAQNMLRRIGTEIANAQNEDEEWEAQREI